MRSSTWLILAGLGLLLTGCYAPPDTDGDPLSGSSAKEAAREIEYAPSTTPDDAERWVDQVLQLINLERAAAEPGLSPVRVNDQLTAIADEFACRLIELDFFDHIDPETGYRCGDRAVKGKYAFYRVGENLAAGQRKPAEVVKRWMESPSHRQIILDPVWKDVGVSVRTGGRYDIYWVVEFGDPANLSLAQRSDER